MDKQELRIGDVVTHAQTGYVGEVVCFSFFNVYVGNSEPQKAILVKLTKDYTMGKSNQLCAWAEDLILHG